MTLEQISSTIKNHERLILGILVLAVLLNLGSKWINLNAADKEKASQQAQAVLQQAQNQVTQLSLDLKAVQAQNLAVLAQVNAQILAQQTEISLLRSSLTKQQQQVKTEPLTDLTAQWGKLINSPDGVKNTDAGIVVNEAASRATVSQLVEVPVLSSQVDIQQKELNEKDSEIASQKNVITTDDNLVAGLKVQLTDSKTACQKEVAAVKASELKSKKRIFVIGYAAGLATRGIIYLFTGI